MEITILGSGTSTGVPMVGCDCSVCKSDKVENRRLRTSILITTNLSPRSKNILVDTTPDLRYQLLRENIKTIDHLIITHEHADHIAGIDDLRPLCFKENKHIPITTSLRCAKALRQNFSYIFSNLDPLNVGGGGIPLLSINSPLNFETSNVCEQIIEDIPFTFFYLPHGKAMETMGFYTNGFAYIPDCSFVPENIVTLLQQKEIDYLLIASLQFKPHDTHLTHEMGFELIKRIAPKRAGQIHLNHKTDHFELLNECRRHFSTVSPVTDQLRINL